MLEDIRGANQPLGPLGIVGERLAPLPRLEPVGGLTGFRLSGHGLDGPPQTTRPGRLSAFISPKLRRIPKSRRMAGFSDSFIALARVESDRHHGCAIWAIAAEARSISGKEFQDE